MMREGISPMRRAFGLNYAIFIMVVIAGMLALALNTGSMVQKSVVDDFIRIQMELYKRSAIEHTLLYLSGDSNRSSKTNTLNVTYDGKYQFTVRITPITSLQNLPAGYVLPEDSNGTVMLDVAGVFNMPDAIEPFRITQRLLVKP